MYVPVASENAGKFRPKLLTKLEIVQLTNHDLVCTESRQTQFFRMYIRFSKDTRELNYKQIIYNRDIPS